MITNVAIRTKSPELVDFFYPNFVRTNVYSPFLKGVIFEGDSKYLQSFRYAKIPYIYVKGTPEYDLTIPENLLNFVYKKWSKEPPKYLLDKFKSNDKVTDELEDIAKLIWIQGKYKDEEDIDTRLEKLYFLLPRGSSWEILCELLEVSESINTEKLVRAVQRYLKDSIDPSKVKITRKNYYQGSLVSFSSRRKNIEPAVMRYLYSQVENNMLKLMILLDELSRLVH